MTIYPIETQNFKLDGGAMFGVVPKSIWQRTNPANDSNLIDMAARSVLIEDGDKLIIVDCGLGDKQSEKFFSHYGLWGDHSLEKSIAQAGFTPEEITDVFFTHLHFDHCGGAFQWNEDKTRFVPTFPNAKYWSNEAHWKWATEPNPREKASFLEENINPIQESGQLHFIPLPNGKELKHSELGFDILLMDGHTDKQMLPKFQYKGKTLVFAADLIPTSGHVPLVYVMGYDTRPLLTMDEKNLFLQEAVENEYILWFEHDPYHPLGILETTERGIKLKQTFSFNEIFGGE